MDKSAHNEIRNFYAHIRRSPMSATSQGAFVDIPETSHSDISYITREVCDQPLPKAIYEKSSKSYI